MSNTSSGGITLIIDPYLETALRLQFVETLLDTALYGASSSGLGAYWAVVSLESQVPISSSFSPQHTSCLSDGRDRAARHPYSPTLS
jgi:hypothetical protein